MFRSQPASKEPASSAFEVSKNRVGTGISSGYPAQMMNRTVQRSFQRIPLMNKRIEPAAETQAALDYKRIEKAIAYLQAHYLEQPDLVTLARAVHMSEFHFQRLFTRWAGISPKRFLRFLTL